MARAEEVAAQLTREHPLSGLTLTDLATLVNDVYAVHATEGEFALKLYHPNRTREAVQWEVDLTLQLSDRGAPVARPVPGRSGYVSRLDVHGRRRIAVLFEWAPGTKPLPSVQTYVLLGEAAARIHRAADGFAPSPARETYDAESLVDDQLRRMRPLLEQTGSWSAAAALGNRLKRRLAQPGLDQGICHLDLTLDNVHVADRMTVFDLDSAGWCWRAIEPYGVLRFSPTYFQAWLAGYRSVRPFGPDDEAAVATFGIVGDLRVVAWKLGVAASSRGTPLLASEELPAVVDGWLDWEASHLTVS